MPVTLVSVIARLSQSLGQDLVLIHRQERLHKLLEQLAVVGHLEVQQFMDSGFSREMKRMTIRPMETTAPVSWRENGRHALVLSLLAGPERQDT